MTTKETLCNSFNSNNEKFSALVKNLVEEKIANYWTLVSFSDTSLQIGFPNGTWSNGSTKYESVTVYFGYDTKLNYSTHEWEEFFKFETNISAMGSFDMIEPSRELKYYKGVGKMLGDKEFISSLRTILVNFSDTIKPIKEQLYDIYEAERAAEEEKRIKEANEKEKKMLDEVQEKIDNGAQYVVIHKGGSKNESTHIYRRKEVGAIFAGTYNECMNEAWIRNHRNYRDAGEYWQCIEASKLKKVA